ncbi:hypothetical protein [Embleya sp. NPDC005971]|uniref:hypothetical protein n=1 Tax=Embleya sp. NPDC005971 TaxID=3156724 RepID=UPI0033CF87DA
MRYRTTAALAVGGVLLALSGCSDSGGGDKPTAQQPPGTVAPPAATGPGAPAPTAVSTTPAGPPAPVAIGQPVTLQRSGGSGITMTALRIADPAPGPGSGATGTRRVAVQWEITASGTQPISSTPADGSALIDQAGQQYSSASFLKTDLGPAMPGSASTAAGDKRTGWVCYEVPTGAQVTKIQYAPGLGLAADTATWTT